MAKEVSSPVKIMLAAVLLAAACLGCGPKPEAAINQPPPPSAPETSEVPAPSPQEPDEEETHAEAKPETPTGPITVVDLHGNQWEGEPKELPKQNSLPVKLAPQSRPAELDAAAYSVRTPEGHLLSMSFETSLSGQDVRDFYMQELSGPEWDEGSRVITGTAKGYEVIILLSEGNPTLYEIQVWA